MKLFEISNHGLALIAVLVAVLWGMIFMERALNLRAQHEYEELLRVLPSTPVVSQPPAAPAIPAEIPATERLS